MSLPIDFVASATALECYESCPRRFRHRYLDHAPAGGPDADAAERMARGELFHRLVLWDDLGLDTGMILNAQDDEELHAQWAAYKGFRATLPDSGVTFQHDQTLVARCGAHLVQAKLDALAITDNGQITIYDWKTSGKPDRTRLLDSPQSKVYPYVVWEVLRRRPGVTLTDPRQIRLVYWFASDPDNPLEIGCTAERLDTSTGWLSRLLDIISAEDDFPVTPDRVICKSCEFLAHCGVTPADGDVYEFDEDFYQFSRIEGEEPLDYVLWPG